jgi:acetyl-CoA carboxylase carboxyl transferase subunit beta
MNWIKSSILSFVQKAKDKFKKERASKKDQEQSLWINCPGCNQMQLKEDLKQNFNICKCSHHFDLDPRIRFEKLLFDEGFFEEIECPAWSSPDPLNIEINGKKYIDKYRGYQKKTGQQSALLIGQGKIGGIKAVAVGYNFAFGGAAFSQRENEHFLAAAQFAMENEVELFLSIYQSGGMSVYGNCHSLKSMSVCQMAYTMLKKKNIITIGILGSKITGGTFVNVFANDLLFSENPKGTDQLFSGKRVSASVRSSDNTVMPSDFGEGAFLEKHGMIDGCCTSRLEVKTKIVTISKVLLKKAQQKPISSSVEIDESSENQIDRQVIKA